MIIRSHVFAIAPCAPLIDDDRAAVGAWAGMAFGAFAPLEVPAVVFAFVVLRGKLVLWLALALALALLTLVLALGLAFSLALGGV